MIHAHLAKNILAFSTRSCFLYYMLANCSAKRCVRGITHFRSVAFVSMFQRKYSIQMVVGVSHGSSSSHSQYVEHNVYTLICRWCIVPISSARFLKHEEVIVLQSSVLSEFVLQFSIISILTIISFVHNFCWSSSSRSLFPSLTLSSNVRTMV